MKLLNVTPLLQASLKMANHMANQLCIRKKLVSGESPLNRKDLLVNIVFLERKETGNFS